MTNQVNNIAAQLSQAVEELTTNMANTEKKAIVDATAQMFQTKLQAKLSDARNEALTEIHTALMGAANQHLHAVTTHLAEKVIENEQLNPVNEPIALDWGLTTASFDKQLQGKRENETKMRLVSSEDVDEAFGY